jgi:predicted AlkP superfamily pyrophosphatase or phosphodiesterase
MRLPALLLALLLAAPCAPARVRSDPQTNTPATNPTHRAARPTKEAATPTPPSAFNGHPKLAIILVIDQFRGDYLDRYRADFKNHGFNLFLQKGAYFPDCYYDYANTKTAPGHATIGTGAYTDGHGISGNDWWDLARNQDRPVTSVEDERYRLVGVPNAAKPVTGSSPRNLLASTVGDELRLATEGQAQVFGVSLKDRAAILPAGAAANGAFWIDPPSGAFVTSTFYMSQLPDWVTAFNASGAIAQAEQDAGLSDVKNFYSKVGATPAANTYELNFAQALIQGEQLGQHNVTDLLTISLSANDIMGHAKGPDSTDEQQMVDALDTQLDTFFAWLDKNIPGGLGNVWIALTADHGVAPVPATAAQYGLNAATLDLKKLAAALDYAINMKFSPGEKLQYVLPHQELPYIALNQSEFMKAGINEQEAESAVQQLLPDAVASLTPPAPEPPPSDTPVPATPNGSNPQPAVQPSDTRLPPRPALFRSYTREQLADGPFPPTPWGELLAHSYSPNGGWYLMVIPTDYQMETLNNIQTTHFSPYSYDRHVPLGFYGAPFAPGIYRGRVEPTDLAATYAALLGINQPSASVGHILTQAFKPASEVTYPKPIPPPHARHTPATHHAAAATPKATHP